MKMKLKREKRRRWWLAWLMQILVMGAVSLLTAAAYGTGIVYTLLLWMAVPLAGAATALRAVRRGLLNYAAWIAPPACLYLAHAALWGYSPSAGAALLCAFVSLVGAAAGEVLAQHDRTK